MTKPKVRDVRIQKSLFYNVHPLLLPSSSVAADANKNLPCARDPTSRDRDETETFANLPETRPRRDVGRSRDRLETRHPRPRPCTSLHDNLINTKYAY